MVGMEKQLAEYRAKKAKEASKQKWSFSNVLLSNKNDTVSKSCTNESKRNELDGRTTKDSSEYEALYPRLKTFLKVVLWCCCFGFFIQIGFGSVFFVLSLFYFMYVSMKSGTRRSWEPSAYSVFNENCEAIEGTLSGEQFDKELKFGAGSVGR